MSVEVIRTVVEKEMFELCRWPVDFAWRRGLVSTARGIEQFKAADETRSMIYCGKREDRGSAKVFAGTMRKEDGIEINRAIYVVSDKQATVRFEAKISFVPLEETWVISGALLISCGEERRKFAFEEARIEVLSDFLRDEVLSGRFERAAAKLAPGALMMWLDSRLS